jgi:threonine synthase
VDDALTRETIVRAHREHGVVLEPHGAVGWAGLQRFLGAHPSAREMTAISLETAHPAKFPDEVRALTGVDPPLPPSLQGLDGRPEYYRELPSDYPAFKDFLVGEYRP